MTDNELVLYPEMNAKIADLLGQDTEPMYRYASAYIKQLARENAALKEAQRWVPEETNNDTGL